MAGCDTTIGICADGTRARSELDKTKKTTEKFSSGVGSSLKKIALMAGGATAAYMAMRKLGDLLKSSLQSYEEAGVANTKLASALKSTGRYSGTTEQALHDFASEMQDATGIADDLTIAASGIMTTFTNIGTDTFPEALESAANMSKMFGQDLQQSVIQLGTALNDPITGMGRLRRIGISFTEEQKESVKQFMAQNDIMSAQRVILDELNVEIGGVARALGQTYAGQVDILQSAFGDLKEQMGRTIANGIKPMLPLATEMVKKLELWVKQKNDLRDAYALLEKPMEVFNDQTKLELLQANQLIAQDELKIIKIRNLIQVADGLGGTYEDLSEKGRELVKQKEDEIRNINTTIGWLEKEIEVKRDAIDVTDGVIDGIDEEVDSIEKEIKIVVESSNAWTRWAEDMKGATDEAINAKRAADELTDSTFDAFHAAEIYTSELNDNTIPAVQALSEETRQAAEDFSAAWNMAFSGVMAASDQYYQNELIALENSLKNQEISEEEYQKQRAAILTKQAKADKAAALISAIVNTAQGVTKAWAQTGIFGFISAAVVLSAGLAQIGLIASQPIPKFQFGGMIGEGYGGGDKKLIAAEEGEMVIRKEVVRTNRSALEAMNAGEPGMSTINVYLGTHKIHTEITKAIRNGQITLDKGAISRR